MMPEIVWEKACSDDNGWFHAPGIGSVRSSNSYRSGGWWFLPDWLPDSCTHDVGPFKTKAEAIAEGERLASARFDAAHRHSVGIDDRPFGITCGLEIVHDRKVALDRCD